MRHEERWPGVQDGDPYTPAGEYLMEVFYDELCKSCARNDSHAGLRCGILDDADAGMVRNECVYRGGKPWCTAFVDWRDPIPTPAPERCPMTMEMFS